MTFRALALVLAIGVAGSVARAEMIDRILAVVARELITLSDVTAAIGWGWSASRAVRTPSGPGSIR